MGTRTQKSGIKAPYLALGHRLVQLRAVAGISRQADFAARVKTKQQTVSRWEAGQSRPREKQLPLIASVLGVSVDELRAAAGYVAKTVVATFDQPFPVDALAPETFERFCAYLLQRLYPKAAVHQMGGRGHTQDGTDILVKMPDGLVHSFQCKRAEEFGPQKVHTAVATHEAKADKKFLVLSRVASPQAREAISAHKCWDIWDKDDLSMKVRSLPKIEQRALVDVFFAGRRFELLGVAEEGVWETTEEFFAAFENAGGFFNHAWKLVGRDKALAEFTSCLNDSTVRIVFLVGSGGSGKSRILKQAIEAHERTHKGTTVRFLSRTAEVTKKSLEELGNKPALLIIDDAHDRTDLPLLFQFTATSDNVRLVLALRPYGLIQLKAQASSFSLVEATRELKLQPLTKQEAEDLAKQVLEKEKGPLEVAKDIANLTYDCPLATVVGAQIVAREKKLFDLAKNEEAFRTTLFGRFANVIAGEIGQKSDAEPLRKLLRVLSLFQPFYLDDKALLALIEKLENIHPHDTNRLLKLLIESGVLFKRGARYRLSPDVLADYIIEDTCVGPHSRSTGYAEKAFDAADDRQIATLLLSLGKLDWQLSNGDASNSHLLDGVWDKLKPTSEYADPYISAVQAIAYYQPLRAITFGEALIRQGQFANQLAEIFKYAAYNFEYVPRACAALWHLGRDDDRQLHQHPNHPIRILAELCEVQPNKPLDYNEAVVEFAISFARDPAEWSYRYTPLDILTAIFKTEGYTTTAKNHAMTFNPFTVSPKAVAKLRVRVLDLVFELLSNPNIRAATCAAAALGEALRYPVGLFNAKIENSVIAEWTNVFCETLERIEQAVKKHRYDPLVLAGIAKAVSWHANYGRSETSKYAKHVRAAISSSLDYRVLSTLNDGYGLELRRFDAKNYEARLKQEHDKLATDVVAAYPVGEDLRCYIAEKLDHIHKTSNEVSGSPEVLYGSLLRVSPGLAQATIEAALADPTSRTARFAANALLILWRRDASEARKAAAAFMRSGNERLMADVGRALAALYFQQSETGQDEISFIKALVESDKISAVSAGIAAIRSLSRGHADEALALVRLAKIGDAHRLADELLCLFEFGPELPFAKLSETDIDLILEKLMEVHELQGHWTETFLARVSKLFPDKTLDFFIKRLEKAVRESNWKYRPINHGPYVHVPLKFKESPAYGALLAKVVGWMAKGSYEKEQKVLFDYRCRELFEAVFGTFDEEVLQFIERWSDTADEAAFKLIANILHEAPHTFVFKHARLVVNLLTKAQHIGPDALKALKSGLFGSAISGIRSGTPGQPFPRDLEAKSECEKILQGLSKFSPAYEVYEALLKDAEANIAGALREREEFED
jgi:transcriptional regulator with XRE-family HTH domain